MLWHQLVKQSMQQYFIPGKWPLDCEKPCSILDILSHLPKFLSIKKSFLELLAIQLNLNVQKVLIYMQYHWLRDRVQIQEFIVIWRKGMYNLAHLLVRVPPNSPALLDSRAQRTR
jgi:hypothetical protein